MIQKNTSCSTLFFKKKKSSTDKPSDILLDDNRYRLKDGDKVITEKVRFRTLGCYPLTAATISNADSVKKIILELKSSAVSERSGRLIDFDKLGSMELKKEKVTFSEYCKHNDLWKRR